MFGRKKTARAKEYDPARYKPILKCSICNGEKVAGFKDLQTGKFEELALIKNEKELSDFMDQYSLTEIEKEY